MIGEFHFIRPLWLLAIVPAFMLFLLLWKQQRHSASWQQAIAPELLEHLLESSPQTQSRWPLYGLLLAWLITSVSLAGPTWNKLPQPVHQQQDALVIVLDLSLSMFAEDVSPSRLQRARHKIHDVLKLRKEGLTALVSYSGDAHVVSPLTDDSDTIANMVPALSPEMMPIYGSNPVAAFELAQQLLQQAGITQGRLLLLTDNITEKNIKQLANTLKSGIELSLLAIGTEDGAPIKARKGFLKDDAGNIIVPKLHRQRLLNLASKTGAHYSELSVDDSDIHYLLGNSALEFNEQSIQTERQFDQWQDRGPWLVLAVLPFALLAFRRGWLFGLPLWFVLPLAIAMQPNQSLALEWQDLWQRPDQRGAEALQQGHTEQAAEHFENPQWRASAHYQAGDYEQAAKNFAETQDASSHYNRGNALARAGQFNEALEAYQQALQLNPELDDAQFNKKLVEELIKQQEQQQSSDSNSSDQNQQQENQQKEQQGQNDQQQSQGDQQPSDQQDQNDQPQDNSQQQDNQQQDKQQQNADQQDPQKEENGQQQTSEDKSGEKKEGSEAQQAQAEQETDPEQQRQQQATEQWLRQIPDDPAGLLRNKFRYQHQQRQQQRQTPDEEQPQW